MKIELVEGAVPFAVHRPRPIPFVQRDAVKVALDSMVADNIIVPVTGSSDWGHPMVEKADGLPRICVDLTRLNKFVKRPVYPPRSPKDAVACISGKAQFFTTVDAVQGYHQVPLHEDSQHLTTFVTPWGRFKFLRGTMGLNATGDEYNRRSDEAVGDLPNTVKVVDDLLVYEETFEEHVERVRNMLQRCRELEITLSSGRKFSFARERVAWAGYVIGPGEISPDPAKLEAITKFPAPTNITEMRRFMGMVEQMAEFSPHISAAATPLRPLLSPSNPFIWNADHEEAFEAVKKTMVDPPSLRQFDL